MSEDYSVWTIDKQYAYSKAANIALKYLKDSNLSLEDIMAIQDFIEWLAKKTAGYVEYLEPKVEQEEK